MQQGLKFPTLDQCIGHTPLVRLQRLMAGDNNQILVKLEGNNPAGSVKDRPAYYMIERAEQEGLIKEGDALIEATSGNTGIALAMAAAIKGYKMKLIMPANATNERKQAMTAYGAELIEVTAEDGMEGARDLALKMQEDGQGLVLNQFSNPGCPESHYHSTGPEIWSQTGGTVTHFVSSMGTTGTVMGTGKYLKEQNPDVQVIGLEPSEKSAIPGIRKWPVDYRPDFFQPDELDQVIQIDQKDAEDTMRLLARKEGIFAGVSSGGAVWAALELAKGLKNATVVAIICDRGDRYLSTGVFADD